MSNQTFEEYEKRLEQDERESEQENGKELELLRIVDDGSAKTFIYKDPDKGNNRESLWARLLGRK